MATGLRGQRSALAHHAAFGVAADRGTSLTERQRQPARPRGDLPAEMVYLAVNLAAQEAEMDRSCRRR